MISCATRRVSAAAAAFACASFLLLSSCDNTVDPFITADRYFTVFGFLDTASDTQFVRVIPLRKIIGDPGERTIDAVVATTAREDGNTIAWRDSVIEMSDGSIAHVFYAPFRPIPGWTYELQIERSDGATSIASTTVPPAERVSVSAPTTTPAGLVQTVTWDDVDFQPFRVEVWYRFLPKAPNRPFREAILTYADIGRVIEDDWQVQVRLTRDKTKVLEIMGEPPENLNLSAIGMRLTYSDKQWRPPGGVFDREVLVQPDVFTNVENGFGFFGSVNQFTVEWTLDVRTTEELGYRVGG